MRSTIERPGVLDKSVLLVNCVAEAKLTLNELVERSGLARATAHRLAVGLVEHGILRRTADGRFALGLHLLALGRAAAEQFPLTERALPVMEELRTTTGESVQLYVRDVEDRVCVAALESPHGLRTIVPVGAALPMDRGSAGHVLAGADPAPTGWVASVEEREAGVASVSAPVLDPDGTVIAALSVSGPVDRMGQHPGERHGPAVVDAARKVSRSTDRSA
ncbi:MAG: IclR family transcriptional regulator [Microthrixaceae bacterium]